VLILELESHASTEVHEKPWKDLEWTRDPEVRAGIRPIVADEAKTAQFLAIRGVVLTNEAQALFLDCVLDEFIAAILLLERRALGDYSTDERPSQFPKFSGRSVKPGSGMSPWTLFEAWVKASQPAKATVNRWRSVFIDLQQRCSSTNVIDWAEDDAREWARKLVTPERSPSTVNDVWLNAARTVFGWAVGERLIAVNPFDSVKVTEPRKVLHRETKAFTPKRRRSSFVRPVVSESQIRPSRGRPDGYRGFWPTQGRVRGKSLNCAGSTSNTADRCMR